MRELDCVNISITALYPTKDQVAQQTRDKIARGELDIGVPIVPIMLERLKNKRERGIRTPNYHYTRKGIWTAANSGKLLRKY